MWNTIPALATRQTYPSTLLYGVSYQEIRDRPKGQLGEDALCCSLLDEFRGPGACSCSYVRQASREIRARGFPLAIRARTPPRCLPNSCLALLTRLRDEI